MTTIQLPDNILPFVIINRDRLTDLTDLINWVFNVNIVPTKIFILDSGSTYRPLIDYYLKLKKQYPNNLKVIDLQFNRGVKAIDQVKFVGGLPYFIYTDPDNIPDENCPPDIINRLILLSDKYPLVHKVGLSFRIDDIPNEFPFKEDIIKNELINRSLKNLEGDSYIADIVSSFALYRTGYSKFSVRTKNLRTLEPLCARHKLWYYSLDTMPEDVQYYISKCSSESVLGKRFLKLQKDNKKVIPADVVKKHKQIPISLRRIPEPKYISQVQPISSYSVQIGDFECNGNILKNKYVYRTNNGITMTIQFNKNSTVVGDEGKLLGRFYISDYRAIIEWSDCLNNTTDIIDFNSDFTKFHGSSVNDNKVFGQIYKEEIPNKSESQTISDSIIVTEEKPKPVVVPIMIEEKKQVLIQQKLAILVSGYDKSLSRKTDFINWNKSLFDNEQNLQVFIISDKEKEQDSFHYDWLKIIPFRNQLGEIKTSDVINFGLKYVLNSDIVIKADIDTFFTKYVLDDARSSINKGMAQIYNYSEIDNIDNIAKTLEEWFTFKRTRTNLFCLAMNKKDWYYLRGYENRSASEGEEDLYLFSKMTQKLKVIETANFPLYRISLEGRK